MLELEGVKFRENVVGGGDDEVFQMNWVFLKNLLINLVHPIWKTFCGFWRVKLVISYLGRK